MNTIIGTAAANYLSNFGRVVKIGWAKFQFEGL